MVSYFVLTEISESELEHKKFHIRYKSYRFKYINANIVKMFCFFGLNKTIVMQLKIKIIK